MILDINTALTLSHNDIVYDSNGNSLIIKDYCIKFIEGETSSLVFSCVDQSGSKQDYCYYHLFLKPSHIQDIDRIFILWTQRNPIFVQQNSKYLPLIQRVYYAGYSDRTKYSAEEQLQK